jgi:hypothetical protein
MAPYIYLLKAHKWYAGGEIIYKYIANYRRVAFMCTWIWMVSYIRYNARNGWERINLYFVANDIRADSKGIMLFFIFLCVEERRPLLNCFQ